MNDDFLDQHIAELLADPQHQGHELHSALSALVKRYQNHVTQLERLTSISDGYQAAVRDKNQTLSQRYDKQMRQLQRMMSISDHYQGMMRDLNEELKVISAQDSLTGLLNRRAILERLQCEIGLALRHNLPLSVAMIDIDHFKNVNDNHGHEAGDRALICVARTLSALLRREDDCARWGGEEFLLLLSDTDGEEALASANRICGAVATLVSSDLPDNLPLSVSIGVAEHISGTSLDETIKRADIALYDAKRAGRNCVVLAKNTPIENPMNYAAA